MAAGLRIDLYMVVHRWYRESDSSDVETSREWRWRMWSSSSIVAASSEGYVKRSSAIANLETATGGVFEKISTPDYPKPYGILTRHMLNRLGYDWQSIPVRMLVDER